MVVQTDERVEQLAGPLLLTPERGAASADKFVAAMRIEHRAGRMMALCEGLQKNRSGQGWGKRIRRPGVLSVCGAAGSHELHWQRVYKTASFELRAVMLAVPVSAPNRFGKRPSFGSGKCSWMSGGRGGL